ncbi:MAG: hypothetical protein RLY58_281 [Pseudomonadota bacterium]|jgi:ATP synthase protein I
MSQPSPLVDRQLARGLTIAQGMVIPVVILIAGLMGNMVWAKSAGFGAFIGWIGSAYFAWQAFRYAGAGASKRILGSFYRGMIGKFVLITLGFAVVFKSVHPLSAAALLIGFTMVQIMAWVYPLWSAKHRPS